MEAIWSCSVLFEISLVDEEKIQLLAVFDSRCHVIPLHDSSVS